jgi:hypothetical protein
MRGLNFVPRSVPRTKQSLCYVGRDGHPKDLIIMGVLGKPSRPRKRRPGEARKSQAELLGVDLNRCINLADSVGTYKIDRFFIALRSNGFSLRPEVPDEVEWIRRLVIEIGRQTIQSARIEIVAIPAVFEQDKRRHDLLLHLQQSIVEVQAAFASAFGASATLARACHRSIETKDRIQELSAVKGPRRRDGGVSRPCGGRGALSGR